METWIKVSQHLHDTDDGDIVAMSIDITLDDLSPEFADFLRPYGFDRFRLECWRIDEERK